MRLFALIACLLSTLAFAYVLPSFSIIKRMVAEEDRSQVYSWKIEGALSFFGGSAKEAASALKLTAEGNELQTDGTVSLRLPGRCRFDAIAADGTSASAISSNGKPRTEGTAIAALQTGVEEICAFLAVRSGDDQVARASVERHLSKVGVDVKRSSLGRFDGDITFVIGDPAAGKPQFHVYKPRAKEPFNPARILFTDAQQQQWDVRFADFFSPVTGDSFPRVTEVWKNGELQLRFTVLKAEPKAQFADKVF